MKKIIVCLGLFVLGWLASLWFQCEVDIKYTTIFQTPESSNQRQFTIKSYPRYVTPVIDLFH